MAQSIPTARIPTPGHLSGICLFLKKNMLQLLHGGASTFIQIPTVGPREGGKYIVPYQWTRSKFDLMIEAKNILIGSSGFLEHYFVCNYNCNALQDRSQKVGF